MISPEVKSWIAKLKLEPHPEGGYYRQTYRSDLVLPKASLPPGFSGSRAVSTAIYFLLHGTDFSAFHRLRSDEMWHFYAGGALAVYVIDPDGSYSEIRLGNHSGTEEVFQAVVKAGCWFGSRLLEANSFALVGCTVSPGFDFEDFQMGKRADLLAKFPQHQRLIEQLTRP